jgi:TPR repeat protein
MKRPFLAALLLPISVAHGADLKAAKRWILLGRPADAEKALRAPESACEKAMRAALIWEDNAGDRALGLTAFNKDEAVKLAKESLPDLRREAERDPFAALALAGLLGRGIGVAVDEKEADRLVMRAAEAGEPLAMSAAADAYFAGFEGAKDDEKGIAWLRKAAAAGDTVAMVDLSERYEKGEGVELSLSAVLRLLEDAAAAGNPTAMYELSDYLWSRTTRHLRNGADEHGETRALSEAGFSWLKRAAEAGHVDAMIQLSHCILTPELFGLDMKAADSARSYALRKKAAASGLPVAVAWLAVCHRFGVGCPMDRVQAARLFNKAEALAEGDEATLTQVKGIEQMPSTFGAGGDLRTLPRAAP